MMQKIAIEALRLLIAGAIVSAGVGVLVVLGQPSEPPKKDYSRSTDLVETVPIGLRSGGLDIDVDGVAVPFREIPVAAEVGGRIVQMDSKVRAGKFVQEGEVLMQLDNRDYELEVKRLNSEITQAKNSLKELEVERQNTLELLSLAIEEKELQERELKRVKALRDRKAASIADVDMALRAVIQAKNGVAQVKNQQRSIDSREERLQAGVDLKQVQLERAQLDLKRTLITAPISGVIVEAPAEEDAYVQRGAPLVTIEDTSSVEIRCQLKLDQLYWLWRLSNQNISASQEFRDLTQSPLDYEIPKAKATVTLDIGDRHNPQRYTWEAELSRFEGIGLDERTRTMPCRVIVKNPRAASRITPEDTSPDAVRQNHLVTPPALIRGMFVDVQIHVPFNEDLLGIPDVAIRPGDRVWVYQPGATSDDDGKLRIVEVDIIRYTSDSLALVRRSKLLDEGAEVVVTPLVAAFDGMEVRQAKLRSEGQPAPEEESAPEPAAANANANSNLTEEDPA